MDKNPEKLPSQIVREKNASNMKQMAISLLTFQLSIYIKAKTDWLIDQLSL